MKQYILNLQPKSKKIFIKEDSEVLGIYIGRKNDFISYNLEVMHQLPNFNSLTHIKAVLFDNATLEINGMLKILKGAYNTDSYLRIDVLLVSENANAKVIPGLEITEDSVKGGHGATISKINQSHLFYLQSRGLSKDNATKLIIKGFIKSVLDKIEDKKLKKQFLNL